MATTESQDLALPMPPSVPEGEEGVEYRKQHAREIADALYGLMR